MNKSKKEEQILSLIKSLLSSHTKEREEAYIALKESGSKFVSPLLIDYLESENPLIRQFCASLLGERREKKAVNPLIKKIKDPDIGVILSAIIALGEIGDKEATLPVAEMLKDESPFFYFIRLNSAATLAKIGDKRAVPLLVEAIKEDDFIFMRSSVEALMSIEPQSAVSPLIDILEDKETLCKAQAAEFLGLLEDKSSVKYLLKALEKENMEVKICALQALDKIKDEASVIPLIKLYIKTDKEIVKKNIEDVLENIIASMVKRNKIKKYNRRIIKKIISFVEENPERLKNLTEIIELIQWDWL